jgi:hypothetical protein
MKQFSKVFTPDDSRPLTRPIRARKLALPRWVKPQFLFG